MDERRSGRESGSLRRVQESTLVRCSRHVLPQLTAPHTHSLSVHLAPRKTAGSRVGDAAIQSVQSTSNASTLFCGFRSQRVSSFPHTLPTFAISEHRSLSE